MIKYARIANLSKKEIESNRKSSLKGCSDDLPKNDIKPNRKSGQRSRSHDPDSGRNISAHPMMTRSKSKSPERKTAPEPSAPIFSTKDREGDDPDLNPDPPDPDHPEPDHHDPGVDNAVQDHLDSDTESADKITPSILNTNWKMELLQVTGPQGKYECKCGNSHATLLVGMNDNDLRNVLLLLDNKNWMITLIEKIDSLLLSMGNSSKLSSIINKFKMDTCLILKARSFFKILDGFKQLLSSTSFQMDNTKICVIPSSFHSQDLEVSPYTKSKVNLGENSSVLVIKPTTNFVVPPFQLVKKYMRLHLKFDSTISFEGQVSDCLYRLFC